MFQAVFKSGHGGADIELIDKLESFGRDGSSNGHLDWHHLSWEPSVVPLCGLAKKVTVMKG